MSIVTRIAPSPTGDPHVGTAYQALFNYVFAKQNKGKFIIRIEDTDQTRFQAGSLHRILTMIDWLGLSPDESPEVGGPNGPYVQSERREIHRRHAEILLERGQAYRSFETAEELEKMREENKRQGLQGSGYNRRYRSLSKEESDARAAAGEPFVIRLKVPLTGETIVQDLLRGPVRFSNGDLDDKVLLKSDGFPTYHLAAMVDDHLMGVSHVIRAEEWLTSTPTHILIIKGFGWDEPVWIHTPLLRNPDKSKLSKRKQDTSVDSYRTQGILPEALLNYLGMMGWSMPDGREIFDLNDMIEHFSWDRVSLGGPVFDLEKLKWLNGKYIREILPLDELLKRSIPFLEEAGFDVSDTDYVREVINALRDRFRTLSELPELVDYFFNEPKMEEKATKKLDEGKSYLVDLFPRLQDVNWNEETLSPIIKSFAEEKGLKLGAIMQPLRAALTGKLESPGMFDLLRILGKEKSLLRIQSVIKPFNNVS